MARRSEKYYYQDISTLVGIFTKATIVAVIFSASSIWMRVNELQSVNKMLYSGGFGEQIVYTQATIFLEIFLKILQVMQFVVPYFMLALLAVWVCLASKNTRALSSSRLICSPGWAAAWFIIPVLNIILPFFILRQIIKESSLEQRVGAGAGLLLVLWWLPWVAGGITGEYGLYLLFTASTPMKMLAAVKWLIWFHAFDMITAILTLLLVRLIHRRQCESFEHQRIRAPVRSTKSESPGQESEGPSGAGREAVDKLIF